MNNGMYATIIKYNDAHDIDVQFDDGKVIRHKSWKNFEKGKIAYNSKSNEEKVGVRKQMNCGLYARVIAYRSCKDIDVQFDDGVILEHRFWHNFKNGAIVHPYINGRYRGEINNIELCGQVNKDNYIYKCKCNKCNKEMLLTPKLILKHKCRKEKILIPEMMLQHKC